jgi:predicted ribosomally synthesized peptide with nif11-like leader
MTKKSVEALLAKMDNDDKFRQEILGAATVDERMKLIEAAGFDCTVDEIEAELSELSDNDLDSVAGGRTDRDSFVGKRVGCRAIDRYYWS